MILITDGRSYDDIRIPAMLAHHKGSELVLLTSLGLSRPLGLDGLSLWAPVLSST